MNEVRLQPGVQWELSDGDTLTFGGQSAPGSPEFYFLFQKVKVRPLDFDAITIPKVIFVVVVFKLHKLHQTHKYIYKLHFLIKLTTDCVSWGLIDKSGLYLPAFLKVSATIVGHSSVSQSDSQSFGL